MPSSYVDIVIVNWNSGEFLKRCVDSILNSEQLSLIGSIIVIDNASVDDSVKGIEGRGLVRLIKNNANLGFAAACNQGFRACQSKYVLLLNPDAAVLPATIAACYHYMESHAEISILGCRLLDDAGHTACSCSRFPKPWRYFTGALGLSKIWPGQFKPATVMRDWDHSSSRKVDQVMGAFMFMPLSLVRQHGFFDERFFVYYEELDFSKRVTDAGGVVYYNHDIIARHTGEGTTRNVKGYRLFLSLNSRLQYARKHFSFTGYCITAFSTLFLEFFSRLLMSVARFDFQGAKEVCSGYLRLWRGKG